MKEITVIKLNLQGEETWRYSGMELRRGPGWVILQAGFNRDDTPFQGIVLKRGDTFIEIYYSDRWYNIFELHDRDSGALKGWYCNVTRPAELGGAEIRYVDLALDLFVTPEGRQVVLDEDEFEALHPDSSLREKAYAALEELKRLVRPQEGFSVA